MWVLVAYDVAADRTEAFRKLLTRYLVHEQNSVFAGALTEATHRQLVSELGKIAQPTDRILQFTAQNRHNVEAAQLVKSEGNGALQTTPMAAHTSNSAIL